MYYWLGLCRERTDQLKNCQTDDFEALTEAAVTNR